jgi:type VI secretion system VasD/TssJ family lipoprotein
MSIIKCAKRSIFLSVSFGLSLTLLSIISSCGSAGIVHVNVAGNDKMNEGYEAFICLYPLKNATNFEHVPVESFWKDGEKAFADDVVGSRIDFMLMPGDNRWKEVQVSKDTKYIGIAVDFRNPDKTGWRLVYDVTVKRPKEILLTVVNNRIEIERKK